jgi:hypothetical protein
MPRWKKSSPALIARFQEALPRDPRVTPRTMFGFPAAFVAEGYFAGLHEERVVVRLPADVFASTKALSKAEGFAIRPGHPMKDWYVVPGAIAGEAKKLGALLRSLLEKIADHPAQPSAAKKKSMKRS